MSNDAGPDPLGSTNAEETTAPGGEATGRRRFLTWMTAAGVGIVAGCPRPGTGPGGDQPGNPGTPFPPDQPEASDTFEVLTTESPVREFDDRRILDSKAVRFSKLNEWSSYQLRGNKPEHQFFVRARHAGWFTEMDVRIVLHGQLARRLVMRNRSDLKVRRLWLSRGYFHGDSGRGACFPAMPQRGHFDRPFEADLWFATLRPGTPVPQARQRGELIARETSRTYRHGDTNSGQVRVDLHDGFVAVENWSGSPTGRRDFQSTWFRGTERWFETLESAFTIREAAQAGCHAVRASRYCDTDDI